MKKKPIVMCDTMIWYDLYDKEKVLDKSKYKYFGSFSNIADFLSSDKMHLEELDRIKLKNAIRTMHEEADNIIMADPTSVGSSEWFKIGIDKEEIENIKVVYKELLRYANREVSSIRGPTINGIINAKNKFRKGSTNVKQQLITLFKSSKYSEKEQHDIIIGNILSWLAGEWNRMRGTSFKCEQISNWKPIEVFVKAQAEFLKTVNPNQEPNKNSMIDFLQLLYINQERQTLIWTTEKKLLVKIKKAFSEKELKNILYQEHIKHYS